MARRDVLERLEGWATGGVFWNDPRDIVRGLTDEEVCDFSNEDLGIVGKQVATLELQVRDGVLMDWTADRRQQGGRLHFHFVATEAGRIDDVRGHDRFPGGAGEDGYMTPAARAARPAIPVDFEDMKSGFQTPKAAALADWSFRKEEREFKVIVNRLRARKWAKENPARANEKSRVYQAKPGVRAHMNAMQNKRRRAGWLAAAPVVTCRGCGVEFCPAFPKKGIPRAFCTNACKSTHHWRARRDRQTGGQP